MEGLAAIGARVAAIQATLGEAPRVVTRSALSGVLGATAAAAATRTGPAGTLSSDFASVLATHTASASTLPSVDGFTDEQTRNAWSVVEAGRSMGLSLRDQAIGVMTAMGESSLRVLDHGDTAGPDSRGLFQQRDNGAWGTYAERMDPTASARSFFRALERVDGRDAMTPTLVAHAVQRNADPNHYTRYWDDAVGLVARLRGVTPPQVTG